LCLLWYLWQERNAWSFEDVETSNDRVVEDFVSTLYIFGYLHIVVFLFLVLQISSIFFFLFLQIRDSCVYFRVLGLCPFALN
jgi:maltodextrin utilization protein YvdJ